MSNAELVDDRDEQEIRLSMTADNIQLPTETVSEEIEESNDD
jgi:hypothetical protein